MTQGDATGGAAHSRAVVILAAGQGKRMHSARPKVLHPVLGEAMLSHVLRTAHTLKPDRIVVVTGVGRAEVEAFVAAQPVPAGSVVPVCAVQPEQRGTGHAVLCAQVAWQGTTEVIVLCGDVPLLRPETLLAVSAARGDAACALVAVDLADPTGYGRLVVGPDGRVERIVEQKDATAAERAIRATNAGLYAFDAAFLAGALPQLRADNAQGELYLTDVAALAAAAGRAPVPVWASEAAEVQGVNNRLDLAECSDHLRRRIVRQWLRAGVSFDAPDSAWVETTVVLEPDASIGADVELRGRTAIAAGARIGRGCVLTDTTVAAGAELLPYSVATGARIGPGAHVGPFAHLRPGTDLGADVKVGNFVETKKARFGPGAKAGHLSYLGDCDIGARSNIGAGTITCNYDGVNKFRTVLGEGVFIGSDTQLVAPVTLGDGAYVGAGTTVTQDVPPGALAVSRTGQLNVEGWVARQQAKRARSAATK
ncbi:MAG: UDP-N-acetylglucosamine diphosphorylase/glucosamine-1-phosphate N-acetyltransferase [Myxococcales bacterium]|nr:UDP-N-acetylglucosamine diphosphorylase/glucosamine-1-phosphate N-acetyltransferase [Myxococcales bacterium]